MNRWNRSFRPARIPSGMPIASESATAASVRPSVSMLASHRPRTPRLANPVDPEEREPPAADRRSRALRPRPTTPGQPMPWRTSEDQLDERSTPGGSGRSRRGRSGSSSVRRRSHRAVVEPRKSRRRSRRVAASTGPAEQDVEDDGRDDEREHGEATSLRGLERRCVGGEADRRHGVASSPSAPAIASGSRTRSTTPTSCPSSTTRIGLSVAVAAWTTVRMIAVGGNAGPVEVILRRRRSRMIQRSVRTWALGHLLDEVADVVVGRRADELLRPARTGRSSRRA